VPLVAAEVAAGGQHSLALTADGRVLAAGNGEEGQLGRALEEAEVFCHVFREVPMDSPPPPRCTKWTRRVPHPVLIGHAVQVPMVESISTIACGDRHCLAVSRDALAVYAWGAAANGRLGLPSVPRPLHTPPSLLPSGWRAGAPCGV
jgi:alpha-tubulin suppressor-like RCC1 family protein